MADIVRDTLAALRKDPKKMLAVFAALAVLALFIYFKFLLKPEIARISTVRGKLTRVSSELKAARSDIARIGAMQRDVGEYNEKVDRYEKTLPTEDGIPGLLENLSGMAKNANMRIAGIVPAESRAPMPAGRVYKEIPITVTAKAGYHELGRFLAGLESSDRFMKVSDMLIRSDKAFPKRHDVELVVVTYVLLEGK